MSLTFTTTAGGPELNVCNGNAATLLELLGLPVDLGVGDAPAAEFVGRALLALAFVAVATDDAHGRPAVADGRHLYGERRAGYLADRLRVLHDIGAAALAAGVDVMWE